MDDLVKRLRLGDRMDGQKVDCKHDRCNCPIMDEAADAIEALQARVAEAERRRDEWRKKAEGYDAVRLALREKVGASWPPNMSRLLWAGIAADEKKRADQAEAAMTDARRDAFEEAAKVAEHLQCETCRVWFHPSEPHTDDICSAGHSSWGGARDAKEIADAIRDLAEKG